MVQRKKKVSFPNYEIDDSINPGQIKHLIDFINTSRHGMSDQQMEHLLRFLLIPVLQDRNTLNSFLSILDSVEQEGMMQPENSIDVIRDILGGIREQKRDTQSNLIRQLYHTPNVLLMQNTKVTNQIFDPASRDKYQSLSEINVGTKQHPIQVPTQVFISLPNTKEDSLSESLTAYDRMVMDGVCTVLINNKGPKKAATASQIYTAFAGKPTTSQTALQNVAQSMEKLENTFIRFDCTKQAQERGYTGESAHISGRLLNFYQCEFVSGGKKRWGYIFSEMPLLYTYAVSTGQLISADRKLLNVRGIKNTDTANLVKTYLIKRIELMKSSRNSINQNRILFEPMMDALELDNGNRVEQKRIRDTAEAILKYWETIGYIQGYSRHEIGCRFAGVNIVPDEAQAAF